MSKCTKTNKYGSVIYPDTIYETVVEFIKGDNTITVSSTDTIWVRKIKKLHAQNPENVVIVAENDDGSICAHMPKEYLKLSKPRTRAKMTDDQKQVAAERLKEARAIRNNKSSY